VNVCGYLVNFGLMNFYIIVLGPFINTYQFWMLYQFNAVKTNNVT
jgi:hypothetical protein